MVYIQEVAGQTANTLVDVCRAASTTTQWTFFASCTIYNVESKIAGVT
jgi:hypothetical protein